MFKVYVLNLGAHEIGVIDVKSNMVITTFPDGEGMMGINFVNGGEMAYIISQSDCCRLVVGNRQSVIDN